MNNDELNTFLAGEVMGWYKDPLGSWWDKREDKFSGYMWLAGKKLFPLWHPTTDIAQAMMCAEKWCDDAGGHYSLEGGFDGNGEFVYRAVLTKWNPRSQSHKRYIGEGTKELAICLALYEAVKGGE